MKKTCDNDFHIPVIAAPGDTKGQVLLHFKPGTDSRRVINP
jgi:hypothetical protein